jgi:hypothetical protein
VTTPAISVMGTAVATQGRQGLGEPGSRYGCRLSQIARVSAITLGGQNQGGRWRDVVPKRATAFEHKASVRFPSS